MIIYCGYLAAIRYFSRQYGEPGMAKKKVKTVKNKKTGSNDYSAQKKRRGLLIYMPAFCSLIGTLMLLTVIAAALPLTVPQYMGYEIYDVVSGSMEPTIPIGSIIYVKEAEPSGIKKGDVIAFKSGDSIVMHRVIDNKLVEGTFTTKGDANPSEDMNEVPYSNLVGIVVRHIPILGQLLILFGSTFGRICMVCFAACGAILNILSARFSDAIDDEVIEESIREKELAEVQSRIAGAGKEPDPESEGKGPDPGSEGKEPDQEPGKKEPDQDSAEKERKKSGKKEKR